jgi:uncharacterized delta-60 repeat protein
LIDRARRRTLRSGIGASLAGGVVALALALTASAAPEPAGSAFGDDGSVTTAFPVAGPANASAVAVQPDGEVVVVRRSGDRFALARYGTDGALDPTFGNGGTVVADVGDSRRAAAAAIAPGGKIVVAGSVGRAGARPGIAVARYNADGSLDASFGDGRVVRSGICCTANAVAVDPEGAIVVAGQIDGGFGVVRLAPDGSLDRSFGTNGVVATGFGGPSGGGRADAVAAVPGGGVVAAGATSHGDFALARYNAEGSLDSSFGTGGRVTTNLGGDARANSVLVRRGGGLVLAGSASTSLALAAYDPDGLPDRSFGDGGEVVDALLPGALAAAPAVGGGIEVITSDLRVARYGFDGSRDAAFGAGGAVTLGSDLSSESPADAEASSIIVEPDRSVLVAGSAATAGHRDFALARYRADGSLDPAFGANGRVTTDPGGPRGGGALAAARQRDGRIVLAGYSGDGAGRRPTLVRYLPDGSLDPSFGDGGVVVAGSCCEADSVVAEPGGRVVVGARTRGGYLVARYHRNGTPDRSFGNRGRVRLSGSGFGSAGGDLVLEPGGKIVVAGGRGGFTLVRLRANGAVDRSFGERGWARTRLGAAGTARGALRLAGGRTLVYGESGGRVVLARYRPDGTLDRRFGHRGAARGPRHAFDGGAESAVVVARGHIVVAGTRHYRFALVGFRPDGALDRSIGGDGTMVSAVEGDAAAAAARASHVFVAGSAAGIEPGGRSRFELARFDAGPTRAVRHLAAKRRKPHGADSPHPVPAFYINAENFQDMKNLVASDVCSYAHSQPPRASRTMVLDFGGARAYGNGSFGAAVNNATFPANNLQIKNALKTAAEAYAACHKRGQAKIIYAVTNHFKSKSSATDAHRIGRHQAATVKQVWRYVQKRGYYPAERAGVGGDIETGYWGPSYSKAMVNGAKAVWDRGYLDFGTAGGCPPHPRGLSAPRGHRCFNDWTLDDVAHVANSGGGDPAPEVYYRGDKAHFDQAAQWANVARRWNGGHATPFRFYGATGSTEFSALTPGESWARLRAKAPGHVGRELLNYKQDRWTAAKGG